MGRPDFKEIFGDELTAQCCEGYYDGHRKDSPDPGPNRHPAYIHGFINGRDDIGFKHGKTAQQRRNDWIYIERSLSDD